MPASTSYDNWKIIVLFALKTSEKVTWHPKKFTKRTEKHQGTQKNDGALGKTTWHSAPLFMARENTAAFDCISACKVLVAGDNEGCVWLYDVNSCVLEADKLKKMQTCDQTQVSCWMKHRIFFFFTCFICYCKLAFVLYSSSSHNPDNNSALLLFSNQDASSPPHTLFCSSPDHDISAFTLLTL